VNHRAFAYLLQTPDPFSVAPLVHEPLLPDMLAFPELQAQELMVKPDGHVAEQ